MKLLENTKIGLRKLNWSRAETFTYFISGVARELHIFPSLFVSIHTHYKRKRLNKQWEQCDRDAINAFIDKFLKRTEEGSYFDFGICKLPDISNTTLMDDMLSVFKDSLLFPVYFNDNYDAFFVRRYDRYINSEGPFGYTDGAFDVTVKEGDIVIDAGAWIGDFSAYAVSKGAVAYAFEPSKDNFELCKQTEALNKDIGQIYPVQAGLGDRECEMQLQNQPNHSAWSSVVISRDGNAETIKITTLDKFVEEQGLERVDFIKRQILIIRLCILATSCLRR